MGRQLTLECLKDPLRTIFGGYEVGFDAVGEQGISRALADGGNAGAVGCVFIAAAVGGAVRGIKCQFDGDRCQVKQLAALKAMELVSAMLKADDSGDVGPDDVTNC